MNGDAETDYFSVRRKMVKQTDVLSRQVTTLVDRGRAFIDDELERRRSAIGGVDNLWLLLVDASLEEFQPHCAATYTLRGKMTKDKLKHLLGQLSETFPRYKQSLIDKGDQLHGARFREKPEFDLDQHIEVVQLPGRAGQTELNDHVGKLLAEEWDLDKPLWKVVLAENYHDDQGAQSAMIMKGHHLNADGQGYVLSQLSLTTYKADLERKTGNRVGEPKPDRRPTKPSDIDSHLASLDPLVKNPALAILFQVVVVSLLGGVVTALSLVEGIIYTALNFFSGVYFYLTQSWRQQFASGSYFGDRVYEREFSASETFSMDDVRLCQRAFSGLPPGSLPTRLYGRKTVAADRILHHITINDVLCACMADVLAAEMAQVGPAPGRWPRFVHRFNTLFPPRVGLFIPINIREPGEWEMTNLTTALITFLSPLRKPVSETTPLDLYKHVGGAHAELMLLKKSYIGKIAWAAWQFSLNQLPLLWPFPGFLLKGTLLRKYVGEPLVHGFISSFSAILTNIPGPYEKKVELGDMEVIRWTALPPQAGKGTLAVGVISYAEAISVSVAADCVPSTRGVAVRICRRFEDRFQFYVDTARKILIESGNL